MKPTSRRPELSEYPPRYERYMSLVGDGDLLDAMMQQEKDTKEFLMRIPEALHDHRYAPDKWTVREVVGHILDTERIFGFRLLSFARGNATNQSRTDEMLYVANAEFARNPLAALVDEFTLVRRSHMMLLQHLPAPAWDRVGSVNDTPVSVRAMAYMLIGHERHHLGVLRSRYHVDA
jgi:DinB family protein